MFQTKLDAFTALAMTQGFFSDVELGTAEHVKGLWALLEAVFPASDLAEREQAVNLAVAVLGEGGTDAKSVVAAASQLLKDAPLQERLELFIALLSVWPTAEEQCGAGGGLHLIGLGFGFAPDQSDAVLAALPSKSASPQPESRSGSAPQVPGSTDRSSVERTRRTADPGLLELQPESLESSYRNALHAYPSIGLGLAAARSFGRSLSRTSRPKHSPEP